MEGIKKFDTFTYKTQDGETIQASKNNGIVTLKGDKNGIRQMPIEAFKKEFLANVVKLERTPPADVVNINGKNKINK